MEITIKRIKTLKKLNKWCIDIKRIKAILCIVFCIKEMFVMRYCELCGNLHRARGYCARHYQNWRRYGNAFARSDILEGRVCKLCNGQFYARGLCSKHYRLDQKQRRFEECLKD
jgi:hypothetical protein